MVYLYWRWPGDRKGDTGELITERKAPYENLAAARGQADHDLEVCRESDDYTVCPVRIEEDGGTILWEAPLPDGR